MSKDPLLSSNSYISKNKRYIFLLLLMRIVTRAMLSVLSKCYFSPTDFQCSGILKETPLSSRDAMSARIPSGMLYLQGWHPRGEWLWEVWVCRMELKIPFDQFSSLKITIKKHYFQNSIIAAAELCVVSGYEGWLAVLFRRSHQCVALVPIHSYLLVPGL